MTASVRGTFDAQEVVIACAVAVLAQLGFLAVFSLPSPPLVNADISDENAQPIAVSITPVLKLGSKSPSKLPTEWQRTKAAAPQAKAAVPSTEASKTVEAIPKTSVADAAVAPVVVDASAVAQPNLSAREEAGAAGPVASTEGSEQGAANGTETDPLKARAADMYRAQLAAWFGARFGIRGKLPFDKLKTLHATARVTVTADRKVGSFSIIRPSGDPTFDDEVQNTLQRIDSSGIELPAPPQMYPGHARRHARRRLFVQRPEELRMSPRRVLVAARRRGGDVRSGLRGEDRAGRHCRPRRRRRPPRPPPADPPNEDLLGTVEVNGSAGGLPPLPKLGIVPIITTGSADSVVNFVVRRDMELSGQFDVLDENASPQGSFTHSSPIDLGAWRGYGAEYVVRVFSQPAANDSAKTELVGDAFLTPTQAQASAEKARVASLGDPAAPPPDPKPAFHTVLPTATIEVRAAAHRLVDQLLGALTGRPGGFSSEMAYVEKVGRWRRVFAIDSDGFDLRAIGPVDATALSPAFGPGGQLFYALSSDYAPFRLVFGPSATPVPLVVPGSIMGLAFSGDHKRMAITVDGRGAESALGRRVRQAPAHVDAAVRQPSGVRAARQGRVHRGQPGAARLRRRQAHLAAGLHGERARLLRHPAGALGPLHRRRRVRSRHHLDGHRRRQHPPPHAARGRELLRVVQPRRSPRRVLLDRQEERGRRPLHHAHPAPVARQEDLGRRRRVAPLGAARASAFAGGSALPTSRAIHDERVRAGHDEPRPGRDEGALEHRQSNRLAQRWRHRAARDLSGRGAARVRRPRRPAPASTRRRGPETPASASRVPAARACTPPLGRGSSPCRSSPPSARGPPPADTSSRRSRAGSAAPPARA